MCIDKLENVSSCLALSPPQPSATLTSNDLFFFYLPTPRSSDFGFLASQAPKDASSFSKYRIIPFAAAISMFNNATEFNGNGAVFRASY